MIVERKQYIDIAKGIGIFLMVVGHLIVQTMCLWSWIYSFHMPLFFIISGYCFRPNKREFHEYFFSRVKRLLVPAFWFTLFSSLYTLVRTSNWYSLKTLYWDLPVGVWFLPVLFVVSVIWFGICANFSRRRLFLVSILFLFVGYFLCVNEIKFPHSMSSVFLGLFFYGFGFSFREKMDRIFAESNKKMVRLIAVLIIFLPIIIWVFGNNHPMNVSSNNFDLISAVVAVLCSCSVIVVSKNIQFLDFKNMISWLGKNSLVIMGLHFLLIRVSVDYILPNFENHFIFKIIQFLFIWAAMIIAVFVFEHFTPFVLGKPYKR